jgi:hypothetical protein
MKNIYYLQYGNFRLYYSRYSLGNFLDIITQRSLVNMTHQFTLRVQISPIQGGIIAESFLLENFGDIGTFGAMGTKIKFFVQKIKNA